MNESRLSTSPAIRGYGLGQSPATYTSTRKKAFAGKLICLSFGSGSVEVWKRRAHVAGLMAGIILAMFMSGCAVFEAPPPEPYWFKDAKAVQLTQVMLVQDVPCAGLLDVWGCADRITGLIFVRADLSDDQKRCVLAHEKHHLAGFNHNNEPCDHVDCGDGTFWRYARPSPLMALY